MSEKAQNILNRYKKSFVTDGQLLKYLELGAITQEEYDAIYTTKHSTETVES